MDGTVYVRKIRQSQTILVAKSAIDYSEEDGNSETHVHHCVWYISLQ